MCTVFYYAGQILWQIVGIKVWCVAVPSFRIITLLVRSENFSKKSGKVRNYSSENRAATLISILTICYFNIYKRQIWDYMKGKNLLSLMSGVDTINPVQTVSEISTSITNTPIFEDFLPHIPILAYITVAPSQLSFVNNKHY